MAELPDMQMVLRPGCIEFGWGHPAMDLLPVANLRQAAAAALDKAGPRTLVYGAAQGPGRLIELIAERLASIDGNETALGRLLITGGVSQALTLLCNLLTQPGDIALVESPVYHFGLRVLRDQGLELRGVKADQDGLQPDALEEALRELGRIGRRARLLYTVPTFSNPTGRNMSRARRARLMEIASEHDLVVLEDDVYRELWFDEPPPPSLVSYGPAANVVRLGSFSKVIAPGLRLGWIVADETVVRQAMQCGLLTSGGGINHFTANVVAEYIGLGMLDEQVERLRAAYRERCEILVAALRRYLPPGCDTPTPGGGFFVWLGLPPNLNSEELLSRAEAGGIGYLPGTRFHTDGGGQQHLRLAFSLLSPEEMEQGAQRLGNVLERALAQAG